MNNLRNKTDLVKNNDKKYFERFGKLNVYSYTKPNDKKIYHGCKPTEVYSVFNGNTSSIKKSINPEENDKIKVSPDDIIIDQSTMQYYIILGMQDVYYNYVIPLQEENKTLKESFNMLQSMLMNHKKKCDERFDFLSKKL